MQVCIPIRGATWPSKIALSVAVVMAVSISLLHLPATEKAQSSFSWFLWEYSASPCIFSYVCSFNQYLSENWIVVCTMLSTVDTVLPICNLHKSSLFLGENPFSLGVGNNSFHSVTITAPGLVNSMLSYIICIIYYIPNFKWYKYNKRHFKAKVHIWRPMQRCMI